MIRGGTLIRSSKKECYILFYPYDRTIKDNEKKKRANESSQKKESDTKNEERKERGRRAFQKNRVQKERTRKKGEMEVK
jgi:hypothetical protein